MSKKTPQALPAVNASAVVELCILSANKQQEFAGAKGAALTAAHSLLNKGGTAAAKALHEAASVAREKAGGKAASKQVKAGYKLAKRYATCAEFLSGLGLSFAAIGEVIGEKATFSVNRCEAYMRTDSDDAAVKASAEAFQTFKGNLSDRCTAADAAFEKAAAEANHAASKAQRDAIIAEYLADQKATAAKAAKKATATAAKAPAKAAPALAVL